MSFSRPTAPLVSGGDSVFFPRSGASVCARKPAEKYGEGPVARKVGIDGDAVGLAGDVACSSLCSGSGAFAGSGGDGRLESALTSTTATAETRTGSAVYSCSSLNPDASGEKLTKPKAPARTRHPRSHLQRPRTNALLLPPAPLRAAWQIWGAPSLRRAS